MLLDTSFLIDLMRGESGAIKTARELESDLVQQRVSAMTLFELFYGVERSGQPAAERDAITSVIESKPIVPADASVMRKAGRIAGRLANDGTPIDDGDVLIGATAATLEEPVLTRNVTDFERIDDVHVESY